MASITLNNGDNIIIGTGTGSMIGTASNEVLAFYGATPIAQPSSSSEIRALLISLGLLAGGGVNDLDTNEGNVAAQNFNTTGANGCYYVNRRDTGAAAFQIYSASGNLGIYNDNLTADAISIAAADSLVTLAGNLSVLNPASGIIGANFVEVTTAVEMGDASAITFTTANGGMIGTATNQKLGFYGATPIVQPTSDFLAGLVSLGLISSSSRSSAVTFPGAVTVDGFLNATDGANINTDLGVTGSTNLDGAVTIQDANNISLGTTNGTQFGTSASQKLAFYGVTPVVQQTGGTKTAAATYGSNEQTMLQTVYNALRTFGLLS